MYTCGIREASNHNSLDSISSLASSALTGGALTGSALTGSALTGGAGKSVSRLAG